MCVYARTMEDNVLEIKNAYRTQSVASYFSSSKFIERKLRIVFGFGRGSSVSGDIPTDKPYSPSIRVELVSKL